MPDNSKVVHKLLETPKDPKGMGSAEVILLHKKGDKADVQLQANQSNIAYMQVYHEGDKKQN